MTFVQECYYGSDGINAVQFIGIDDLASVSCLGPIVTSQYGIYRAIRKAIFLRLISLTDFDQLFDKHFEDLPRHTNCNVIAEHPLWFIPADSLDQKHCFGYEERN